MKMNNVLSLPCRLAIIDMGTNTFHLLAVEVNTEKESNTLVQLSVPVKLGEGGINQHLISPAAFNRGIAALQQFSDEIKKLKIVHVKAIATSAMRSAQNANEFIEAAAATGIYIEIIDGNKEAELIYKGVKQAIDLGSTNSLIMDIGGGSVEFIICNRNELIWKQSFNIGAARLIERFHRHEPIGIEEINELRAYLKLELKDLFEAVQHHQVYRLVGSAGSFETFAQMILKRFGNPSKINNKTTWKFDIKQFEAIYTHLLNSTLEERLKTPGLIAMRADMIVVAAVMTKFIIDELNIREMHLSTYALKEGILAEMIYE